MNHSPNSHSRMFLMELIIAILFFSLAGAICLRMFAVSRKMSDDTTALNMAMNQASNVAVLYRFPVASLFCTEVQCSTMWTVQCLFNLFPS